MDNPLLIASILSVRGLDNNTIAAANNALSGFGKVSKANLAFDTMKDINLIRENGKPYDSESLLDALSFVIQERLEAGTFV